MFQVQRATPGVPVTWKTVCRDAREAYAREIYARQLAVNTTGRFRLVSPAGEVLAEATPKPLFERRDDEEHRLPTYYAPPEAKPGKT